MKPDGDVHDVDEAWAAYLAHFDVYDQAYIRLMQGVGQTFPAREVLDLD